MLVLTKGSLNFAGTGLCEAKVDVIGVKDMA
jgi:hypothetical protein